VELVERYVKYRQEKVEIIYIYISTKFNSKDKQNRESTEPENTYPIQKKSEHQRLGREFETDLAKKKEIDLKNRA